MWCASHITLGCVAIVFVLTPHSVLSIGMLVVTFLVLQRELGVVLCVRLPHVQTVLLLLHGIQTAFCHCRWSPASFFTIVRRFRSIHLSLSLLGVCFVLPVLRCACLVCLTPLFACGQSEGLAVMCSHTPWALLHVCLVNSVLVQGPTMLPAVGKALAVSLFVFAVANATAKTRTPAGDEPSGSSLHSTCLDIVLLSNTSHVLVCLCLSTCA
jgi:hypothetical protein